MRTTRAQMIAAVLTLAREGELDILPKLVKRDQLEVALELGTLVRSFNYVESVAFADAARGKSAEYVAALRRRFSEPAKRAEMQNECYDHVSRILSDGAVERYFAPSAGAQVRSIRRKLEELDAT
jgi:hypothetical protein